ncbi:MAG: transcriptional regulator [Proteobacteria bacterium]|nr:transcriptional regulator [Pseudomonadota bacterium]
MTDPARPDTPRYAYEGLDRVIHERARLSVLTSLLTRRRGLSFAALKKLCALTDGNLARHLQVLEAAGMVSLSKASGLRRQTLCRISAHGRRRYLEYIAVLEQVLRDAQAARAPALARRPA